MLHSSLLCVSKKKTSSVLSALAELLINAYFLSWFEIKLNNKITDNSINFFNIVQNIIKFSKRKIQDVAIHILQKNAYFAHHENVLIVMLGDDDEEIFHLAVNKILAI